MVTLCDDRVDGNHPTPTLLPLHIDLHTARATFGSFDRFAHRTISLLCEEMQMEIEMALATIYHAPYNIIFAIYEVLGVGSGEGFLIFTCSSGF